MRISRREAKRKIPLFLLAVGYSNNIGNIRIDITRTGNNTITSKIFIVNTSPMKQLIIPAQNKYLTLNMILFYRNTHLVLITI